MKKRHFDPNNHAPEVAPDDSWGDLRDGNAEKAPAKLPERKSLFEKKKTVSSPPAQAGLVIESVIPQTEVKTTKTRLKVQEIGGKGIKRLDAMLPMPEKVAYQGTFKEKPKEDPAEAALMGEDKTWGDKKLLPTKHLLIMGGLIMASVTLAIILLPFLNSFNASKGPKAMSNLTVEAEEEQAAGMAEMNFLSDRQNQAMEIFRSYILADTIDEIIPFVSGGASARESLSRQWKPLNYPKSWKLSADTDWQVPLYEGQAYGLLVGQAPDQSTFCAYFVKSGDGILLDWKATHGYCSGTFSEYSQGKGDGSEVRGVLSTSNSFDPIWPESTFVSYRLSTASGEESIWCYARRGEPAALALDSLDTKGEIINDEPTMRRYTIRIVRGPAESLPNQWMIQEVLNTDWLTLPSHP